MDPYLTQPSLHGSMVAFIAEGDLWTTTILDQPQTATASGDAASAPSLACSRRPYLASECKSLPEAEKWRREILREVTKTGAAIQNGA